jgi:hypothetical protein
VGLCGISIYSGGSDNSLGVVSPDLVIADGAWLYN